MRAPSSILGEHGGPLTPEKARELGIGAVYQEPSLVPYLTVLENMFLGRELRHVPGVLGRQGDAAAGAARRSTASASQVALGREVSRLSVAERQLVEIARALALNARVLIFDEPSAILSGPELERVFTVIQELKASGARHPLHLAPPRGDLPPRRPRDGAEGRPRRRDAAVEGLTTDELIRLMVGRDIGERPARKAPGERVVLEARDLELRPDVEPVELRAARRRGARRRRPRRLEPLAARERPRRDPARALRARCSGTGTRCRIRRPRDAVRAGIVVIPEDRKREGLILDHSVRGNVGLASLAEISHGGIVSVAGERRLAEETVRRVRRAAAADRSARAEPERRQPAEGRAREVARAQAGAGGRRPRRADARRRCGREVRDLPPDRRARRRAGPGVLLISSELPEVIAMSDRILVDELGGDRRRARSRPSSARSGSSASPCSARITPRSPLRQRRSPPRRHRKAATDDDADRTGAPGAGRRRGAASGSAASLAP